MGEEALTALFIILPPHYVRSHDLRCPAAEKCLQLQNRLATLSKPSQMESRKSVRAAPEGVWWFLGQLMKTDSSLHLLRPALSIFWDLCGDSASVRDNFSCCTFLQPKV